MQRSPSGPPHPPEGPPLHGDRRPVARARDRRQHARCSAWSTRSCCGSFPCTTRASWSSSGSRAGASGPTPATASHTFSHPLYLALRDRNTVLSGLTGQLVQPASLVGDDRNDVDQRRAGGRQLLRRAGRPPPPRPAADAGRRHGQATATRRRAAVRLLAQPLRRSDASRWARPSGSTARRSRWSASPTRASRGRTPDCPTEALGPRDDEAHDHAHVGRARQRALRLVLPVRPPEAGRHARRRPRLRCECSTRQRQARGAPGPVLPAVPRRARSASSKQSFVLVPASRGELRAAAAVSSSRSSCCSGWSGWCC